jgi:hypothetical protein
MEFSFNKYLEINNKNATYITFKDLELIFNDLQFLLFIAAGLLCAELSQPLPTSPRPRKPFQRSLTSSLMIDQEKM